MQKKIGYIIGVLFVLLTKCHYAADVLDSVQQIDTVRIHGNKPSANLFNSYSIIEKENSIASLNTINGIADVLQRFTSAQVNSYGAGNIASISIRGTNDDQSNVYWNGIKFNSLTLGTTDLSIIPIESTDALLIDNNSSAIGGNVQLQTRPNWSNIVSIKAKSDLSSFDNYKNGISLKVGNSRIQFHSDAYYHTAKNNFTFKDIYKFGNPIDTANHNQLKSIAAINQLFFQFRKQIFISIGSLYNKKDKDLPAIMGTNELSSKFQKDKTLRHFITIDKSIKNGDFNFSFSHAFDELLYTDKRLPTDTFLFINSNYKSHRIASTFKSNSYFKYKLSLQTGYTYCIQFAQVKEYGKKHVLEHIGDVYAKLKWENNNFNSSLSITQPFSSFKYIRPQFTWSAAYKTNNTNKQYTIQLLYSDTYRFPDMNDRYWSPGGNPKLKPEHGWKMSVDNSFRLLKNKNQFSVNTSVYVSIINNNIVWTPITNAIWTPKNLKKTRMYGVETAVDYSYRDADKFLFQLQAMYLFNKSQILQDYLQHQLEGKYLRYKPQHSIKLNMYVEQMFVGFGANYTYTSLRYTDEDNLSYYMLKPFHLLDAFITFKGTIQDKHTLQFLFRINNITNTAYESIRSYAQPLRNYTISFIYKFSKHQTTLK